MSQIVQWFAAGSPPRYVVILGVVYSVVEFALGESKSVRANSVLALVRDGVAYLLRLAGKLPPPPPLAPVVVLALILTGCAPAYVTAGAAAKGLETALGGYQIATHTIRRQIVAGCPDVPCREARLAPFEAKQAPVLACVEALAPIITAAHAACEARNAAAAASLLPSLVAPALACEAEIARAVRQ